mgnify:CR=1 FL=1
MFLSIKVDGALNQDAATLFSTDRPAFRAKVQACVEASSEHIYDTNSTLIFTPWNEMLLPSLNAMLYEAERGVWVIFCY